MNRNWVRVNPNIFQMNPRVHYLNPKDFQETIKLTLKHGLNIKPNKSQHISQNQTPINRANTTNKHRCQRDIYRGKEPTFGDATFPGKVLRFTLFPLVYTDPIPSFSNPFFFAWCEVLTEWRSSSGTIKV